MIIGNGHINEDLWVAVCCRRAALCTPASADTGLAFSLGWLETLRDFLRLIEVFRSGAPEEQASGDASHGDSGVDLCSHSPEQPKQQVFRTSLMIMLLLFDGHQRETIDQR